MVAGVRGEGNWYPWERRRRLRERAGDGRKMKKKVRYCINCTGKSQGERVEKCCFLLQFSLISPSQLTTHPLSQVWNAYACVSLFRCLCIRVCVCVSVCVCVLTYHDFFYLLPHRTRRQMLHGHPRSHTHTHTHTDSHAFAQTQTCTCSQTQKQRNKWRQSEVTHKHTDHCRASRSQ